VQFRVGLGVVLLLVCNAASGEPDAASPPAPRTARRASKDKHAPPAKIEPPAPPQPPEPVIDELACAHVVQKNHIAMKLCYQRILKREPELRVKMTTRVRIANTGHVTRVSFAEAALAREDIGQCLARAIEQWEFPTASAEYDFEFPILLMRD
jgi:hypothetical protein